MALFFIFILFLGWHYPLLGYLILLCMFLGIGIGFLNGRKWCDWYCPRGSFYDALIAPLSRKRRIPGPLRKGHFRIGILVFLMLLVSFNLYRRWPDPYKIGLSFVILVTVTTLLGIILAVIFHPRTWCSICPVGTLINLSSRDKCLLRINSELCVECKICAKVCPMQLKPHKFKGTGIKTVNDKDCLKCGLCIGACPKSALKFS